MRALLVLAVVIMAAALLAFPGPRQCPDIAEAFTVTGWQDYRAGRLHQAEQAFRTAAGHCPGHGEARVGLGYVALRRQAYDSARSLLRQVLAQEPGHIDALVGLGLAEARAERYDSARAAFEHALRLDPARADVTRHLARLPAPLGPPPVRPPLTLPDSLQYWARAAGDLLEVRTATGWTPFYVRGVNLGVALPGHFPSQFPDSATYASWLGGLAALGANTIRLYTLHPPSFYQAVAEHNRRHPEQPLRLLQGVWAELPPGDDYYQPAWQAEFLEALRVTVDAIHGRADVPQRPGHAGGYYTADVSAHVLGLIIGREWEPFSVAAFNERYPARTSFGGAYLQLQEATPMDVWLAGALEHVVAYESETYRTQRPVAYTNWPTLDPMQHASELDGKEELAIRGIVIQRNDRQFDEDRVSVAAVPTATQRFPAGYFAAFHAYPYYPDFLLHEPTYAVARSPYGPSSYFGYLADLKRRFPGTPVLIAEYGVPASWGIAHFNPQGWHHGGLTEAAMADVVVRLTREIEAAGMAGGAVFSWMDEWFKVNWLNHALEVPAERGRMWWNRMNPEQHYGLLAVEPELRLGAGFEQRQRAWDTVPPLYASRDGSRIRAHADEAYLWVQVSGPVARAERVLVGIDVVRPEAGGRRLPGTGAPRLPVGVEFVLQVQPDTARLLAWPRANPYRVQLVPRGATKRDRLSRIDARPPGFFTGSYTQELNQPFLARRASDGRFDPLYVVVNRARVGEDSSNYLGMGYDRGVLPPGPLPDGAWERSPDGASLEVRIPWVLINVTDPSSRTVVAAGAASAGDVAPTTQVPSIGIVAAALGRDGWRVWPESGRTSDVAAFSWPGWNEPRFRLRRRPVYYALRELFTGEPGRATSTNEADEP